MDIDTERCSIFHTYAMKDCFCKTAQPFIDQAIAFISSIFQEENERDWNKLLRIMFLEGSINYVLTLEADDTNTLTW